MTLRDSHNRCVTCGRTPTEECCEKCPHPEKEAVNQ